MTIRKYSFLLVLLFLCLQIGCEENDGPTGLLSGTLSGYVGVYSQRLARTDTRGVEIIAEGTIFHTQTDSGGRWKLVGVPSGIYSLLIRKDGYGYTRIPNLQFVGGGELRVNYTVLLENPSKGLADLSLSITPDIALHATGTISNADSFNTYLRFFLGNEPPDAADGTTYFFSSMLNGENQSAFDKTILFPEYDLGDLVVTGDTVHVAVYVVASSSYSYFDPASNGYCYTTGINPVPARATFVMP